MERMRLMLLKMRQRWGHERTGRGHERNDCWEEGRRERCLKGVCAMHYSLADEITRLRPRSLWRCPDAVRWGGERGNRPPV